MQPRWHGVVTIPHDPVMAATASLVVSGLFSYGEGQSGGC